MAGLVEAIGVVSGLLSVVNFGIDNFAPAGDGSRVGSVIKVAVALEGPNGPTNAGGDLPDVRVFNQYGSFVGAEYDPGTVRQGSVGQVFVGHENQGVYSLMSANDDAICVAWITTTWSKELGGNHLAVSGDFGRVCGGTWYLSGMMPSSDSAYQPDCFWIDANGDQPQTGFQVRWPAFAGLKIDEDHSPEKFCNGVDFGLRDERDPHTIRYWKQKPDETPLLGGKQGSTSPFKGEKRKRKLKRAAWASREIVLGDAESHSAKRLCESETSIGPDFANTAEGLFCDMGSHTLYPFCEKRVTADCFDIEFRRLSFAARGGARLEATSKTYERVRDWRFNKTVV